MSRLLRGYVVIDSRIECHPLLCRRVPWPLLPEPRERRCFFLHFLGVNDDIMHLCLTLKPVWDGSFLTTDSKSQNDLELLQKSQRTVVVQLITDKLERDPLVQSAAECPAILAVIGNEGLQATYGTCL